MDKVLVRIYVPMIEAKYDVFLPLNKKIYSVLKLLIKAIGEFSGTEYKTAELPVLYDRATAIPYDVNQTVKDSNIRNGTEIVLI